MPDVAPLGTVPLAALLRANLIEMLRAKITTEQRAKIAQRLLKYVTSPQLKNPIEEVIQLSTQLQNMVEEEYRGHVDMEEAAAPLQPDSLGQFSSPIKFSTHPSGQGTKTDCTSQTADSAPGGCLLTPLQTGRYTQNPVLSFLT
jgi:hypothetical protein